MHGMNFNLFILFCLQLHELLNQNFVKGYFFLGLQVLGRLSYCFDGLGQLIRLTRHLCFRRKMNFTRLLYTALDARLVYIQLQINQFV